MSKNNYKLREPLNRHLIIDTIKDLQSIDGFNHRKAALQAIIDIVIAIQDSYHSTDGQNVLIETITQVLVLRPVVRHEMEISKSALAKKPLIMQLLIQMQDIVVRNQRRRFQQKLLWLSIALHTAVLLMHHNKKTHTNNMLMQFKLAQFSESNKRTWIWHELPDMPTMSANGILASLENVLAQLESRAETEIKNLSSIKSFISQISKIIAAYKDAHYLKQRIKIKPAKHIKPINSATMSGLQPKRKAKIAHSLPDTDYDIDHKMPVVQSQEYAPQTETYEGLATSNEEMLDHHETPFIRYESFSEKITPSVPVQTIDLSLQQNHIAQNDLALNSNTRVLSKNSYQAVFATLHQDANSTDASYHSCASVLLLSMITALPVESLLIAGYIGHPGIFKIGTQRSYIQHQLGITKRDGRFDESKHDNQFDVIKIPLPQWLVDDLLGEDLPSIDNINAYIKQLRAQIGLPYLSVSRIEMALPIVLSRYTADSHAHIADLICRTPAPLAPAMYYSGHDSEEIYAHYKSALEVLNNGGNFDSSYITPWHKYSVGSVFAFTPEYACSIMNKIFEWVNNSPDADTHFNRISIFTWFVFCLLTGVRPNNGIGRMSDIDLASGWLLVDDKPVRQVQSHRLIPLCPTLQRYLNDYKNYLINYQLSNLLKHDISVDIDAIRLGDDVALLRLLSDSFDALTIIKRGDAYQMTKSIIDENPYWTRHFVRSQLEKLGVDLALINTVIGHEKARQEVLGRFSSLSKSQIKGVGHAFERIAVMLGLNEISIDRGASCCPSL